MVELFPYIALSSVSHVKSSGDHVCEDGLPWEEEALGVHPFVGDFIPPNDPADCVEKLPFQTKTLLPFLVVLLVLRLRYATHPCRTQ